MICTLYLRLSQIYFAQEYRPVRFVVETRAIPKTAIRKPRRVFRDSVFSGTKGPRSMIETDSMEWRAVSSCSISSGQRRSDCLSLNVTVAYLLLVASALTLLRVFFHVLALIICWTYSVEFDPGCPESPPPLSSAVKRSGVRVFDAHNL